MNKKQRQSVGNNSTAIQVSGDIVLNSPYSEIKEIFIDLFKLNFPQIQDIARQEADRRVQKGLEAMEKSFNKYKDKIDTQKFYEPNVQFELQELGKNIARFGDKSNLELLCELFSTIVNKETLDIVNLIAGEALQVVPKLSNKHLSILALMCLVYDLTTDNMTLESVNQIVHPIVNKIKEVSSTTNSDLSFLMTLNCINRRGITIINNHPSIVTKTDEYVSMGARNFSKKSIALDYTNLSLIYDWMNKCQVGRFELSPLGRLIGINFINEYLKLDINQFVI